MRRSGSLATSQSNEHTFIQLFLGSYEMANKGAQTELVIRTRRAVACLAMVCGIALMALGSASLT